MRRIAKILGAILTTALLAQPISAGPKGTAYKQTDLVSDIPHLTKRTDVNLINPWGVAQNPETGFVWVADNGTGVATVYSPHGQPAPTPKHPLVVTIPPPAGGSATAAPTGIVFNPTDDFDVTSGGRTGPGRFLFVTEDGTIVGWNPEVDLTHAILAVDNSAGGAVYKGVALVPNGSGSRLYATNFCAGTIEVYDQDFSPVTPSGGFTDPSLPADFVPFNIRNLDGILYVTYAKRAAGPCKDDEPGPGNGFVNAFDPDGHLLMRVATEGTLNSPWGLALAPPHFGVFSHALLVGNFGDGRINAFDPQTGTFLGQLEDKRGHAITIDGLWGLTFSDRSNDLLFVAGINDENDGLFGVIKPSGALKSK